MEGRWKKVAAHIGQPRKSLGDGSGNAHASKTTKRGAAGFGVVSGEENLGQPPRLFNRLRKKSVDALRRPRGLKPALIPCALRGPEGAALPRALRDPERLLCHVRSKQMPGSWGEHRDPGWLFRVWRTGEGTSGCPTLQGQRPPGSGSLTLTFRAPTVYGGATVADWNSGLYYLCCDYFFCASRMYPMTILIWSAVTPLLANACIAFLSLPPLAIMSVRSASEAFLASSETRLGILAAGFPPRSAPWHIAHFVL